MHSRMHLPEANKWKHFICAFIYAQWELVAGVHIPIISVTNYQLWTLDRGVFNQIYVGICVSVSSCHYSFVLKTLIKDGQKEFECVVS